MSAIADSVGYTEYSEAKSSLNRLASSYNLLLEAARAMLKAQPTHQFLNSTQCYAMAQLEDQIENSENALLSESD